MEEQDGMDGREYHGWKQMKWTGWKARYGKTIVEASDSKEKCPVCQQRLTRGQEINRQQNGDAHWRCVNPNDEINYYMGQWVFYRPAGKVADYKYCYVNVPPAGAGLFGRGANFNTTAAENVVFEDTPEEVKERLKAEGLERMYALIDELEKVPVGSPEYYRVTG